MYLSDGNRQSVSSIDAIDGPQVSPSLPPKPPPVLYIVEAQFDCKPDNKDELAFQEGDKIAVIKVHSNDWLVRIVGTVHYLELSANFTTVYVQIFEGHEFHESQVLTFSTILFS